MGLLPLRFVGTCLVTGGALYFMNRGPNQWRTPVMSYLNTTCGTTNVAYLINGLAGLFAMAVLCTLNRTLDAISFNHWKLGSARRRWQWSSEVVVITGGCSGLGKALVQELLRRGIKTAVLDVNPPPADLKEQILFIKTNITSIEDVRAAGVTIRQKFGSPSILINCAGVLPLGLILEGQARDIERNFTINTMSHFWTAREFVPDMIKANKGHIVCIASMASFASMPGIVAYGCSKVSALAFQEGLAAELKHVYQKTGAMLTTVHPGNMDTSMLARFHDDQNRPLPRDRIAPEYLADKIVDQIQSGRGAQLILPNTIKFKIASMLRAFPNWLQEGFRDIGLLTGEDCPLETLRQRSELCQ